MISLTEIRERTEKNANLSSDDFGHDCQALLLAESNALQIAAEDVRQLLAEIDRLEHLQSLPRVPSRDNFERIKAERDSLSKECEALRSGIGWARTQTDETNLRNCLKTAWDKADKIRDEREAGE